TEDRAFSSGFELFYSGPQWFLNALASPGGTRTMNARLADMSYDRAGDRVYDATYVGTLDNAYNSDVAGFSSPFFRSTYAASSALISPLAPTVAGTENDFFQNA